MDSVTSDLIATVMKSILKDLYKEAESSDVFIGDTVAVYAKENGNFLLAGIVTEVNTASKTVKVQEIPLHQSMMVREYKFHTVFFRVIEKANVPSKTNLTWPFGSVQQQVVPAQED